MVVDRRITGVPTENIEVESVTVETPDLSIEGVEMTEDGGAIINPIEVAPENQFDSNLAESGVGPRINAVRLKMP